MVRNAFYTKYLNMETVSVNIERFFQLEREVVFLESARQEPVRRNSFNNANNISILLLSTT